MSIQQEMEAFATSWKARRPSPQRMLEKPYEDWTDLELRKGSELFEDIEARRAHQTRRHAALRMADQSGFFETLDKMERREKRKFSYEEIDCELDRHRHLARQKKLRKGIL